MNALSPFTTTHHKARGKLAAAIIAAGALAHAIAQEEPAMNAPDLSLTTLRVARPTDRLDAVTAFYRDGLGFDVLFEFRQHAGFDGVMLGRQGTPFHLEFTRHDGHPAGRAPSADHLLVFYLPDQAEYRAAIERLERAGHAAVASFNPYWDKSGTTFEDPDGYRVVLQNSRWPPDGVAP